VKKQWKADNTETVAHANMRLSAGKHNHLLHKVSIVHIWLRKVCKGNVILVHEYRTCHEGHSSIWIRHDLIGEKHRNVELCGELGDAAQPVEIMCFSCMS